MSDEPTKYALIIHSCSGSAGEAIPAVLSLGPYDEETAKAIEKEFHERSAVKKSWGELWMIAEPLERISGTAVSASKIVDELLKHEAIKDYVEDDGDDDDEVPPPRRPLSPGHERW